MHRRDALKILAAAPLLAVGPCDPVPEDVPLILRTIRRGPLVWTRDDDGTIRVDSADPRVELSNRVDTIAGREAHLTNLYVRRGPDDFTLAAFVGWRPLVDGPDWRIVIAHVAGRVDRFDSHFFSPAA